MRSGYMADVFSHQQIAISRTGNDRSTEHPSRSFFIRVIRGSFESFRHDNSPKLSESFIRHIRRRFGWSDSAAVSFAGGFRRFSSWSSFRAATTD
jgi:hypothetical protein